MNLPLAPPILPMLAKRVDAVPASGDWIFEPKWDGFRILVFRDGDEVLIQSRDTKSLNRYFPEMVDPLRAQLPTRCILDGELVIARQGRLDFDALQLRIHPAASRVKLLASETPASVVFFDLLSADDRDLTREPFAERRAANGIAAGQRRAARPHHAGHPRSCHRGRLVQPLRRRRPRRCHRQAGQREPISPTSASCSR